VRLDEDEFVSGNLLIVGNDLGLEGQIGGNLVVIGGDAHLVGTSRVGGDVSVIGGDANVKGSSSVGGHLAVVGGDVDLTGTSRIGGNVSALGGNINQDPGVLVGGRAGWSINTTSVAHSNLPAEASPRLAQLEAQQPPEAPQPPEPPPTPQHLASTIDNEVQAQIALHRQAALDAAAEAQDQAARQRVTALEAAARSQTASTQNPWFLVFLGKLVQAFLWTLLITGLVLLFAWLLPKQVRAVSKTAEKETALSFATGAIAVAGSAFLVAILTITICFAPLALPLLALLALVILCGWTVTCYLLGRRLDELLARQDSLSWNPLVSVGLSSLVITGVTTFSWAIFPCLGFIVALLIGSTGTGAVIVHVARGSGRLPNGVPKGGPDAPEPEGDHTAPSSFASSDPAVDAPIESKAVPVELTAEADEPPFEQSAVTGEEPVPPATQVPQVADSLPVAAASQDTPDDLTRIVGIGSVFSGRLRDAGITTFSQLAALDAEQIAQTLGCPASRVQRERLREQARDLASPQ
jgi:predicted flap endonuclease-1-like 5' DNA nuclease